LGQYIVTAYFWYRPALLVTTFWVTCTGVRTNC